MKKKSGIIKLIDLNGPNESKFECNYFSTARESNDRPQNLSNAIRQLQL